MYKYRLSADVTLEFETREGVFFPTSTSNVLIEAIRKHTSQPGKLLDLGCGIGVVGTVLHRMGLVSPPLFASDLGTDAVKVTEQNCARNDCPVVARPGGLFEPWAGSKFDYIVDDVSGVAEEIANVSPWFRGVSCRSGRDGAELVVKVIREAPPHLEKNGKLFFPVLSLSNTLRLVEEARKCFSTVEMLSHRNWPLPDELMPHLDLLRRLRDDGCIQFEEKYGMVLWYTDVYVAHNC